MDDLLALRANEGSAWARSHVNECPACQAEREALYQRVAQLKALPSHGPARDRWPVVRELVVARRVTRRRRRVAWGLAAAAVLGGLMVLNPFAGTRAAVGAELEHVKRRSASLEAELQRYDPDSRVVSGRAAALAAELEDRIAAIDGELAQMNVVPEPEPGGEVVRLWQDRVDLMQRLVDVHIVRASYVGL